MIVVDTSALAAIVFAEPEGLRCLDRLMASTHSLISAATLGETLIVSERRGTASDMKALLDKLALDVVSVTDVFAHKVAAAYALWGKGVHPARLNFGDCFAYALARERDCPLLYIGNDFARTDIAGALD